MLKNIKHYSLLNWQHVVRSITSLSMAITCSSAFCEDVQSNQNLSESSAMDAEFLEFVSEFEDLDDESFELILFHGLRDSEKQKKTMKNANDQRQNATNVSPSLEQKNLGKEVTNHDE